MYKLEKLQKQNGVSTGFSMKELIVSLVFALVLLALIPVSMLKSRQDARKQFSRKSTREIGEKIEVFLDVHERYPFSVQEGLQAVKKDEIPPQEKR